MASNYPSSPWPRQAGSSGGNGSGASSSAAAAPPAPAGQQPQPAGLAGAAAGAAPAPAPAAKQVILVNLVGDDFRHPLDQQNTALLRALPGLEGVARNIMGPAAEQVRRRGILRAEAGEGLAGGSDKGGRERRRGANEGSRRSDLKLEAAGAEEGRAEDQPGHRIASPGTARPSTQPGTAQPLLDGPAVFPSGAAFPCQCSGPTR